MSVEKMQKYKENKANRKELLEKEKRNRMFVKIGTIAAAVIVVVGIAAAIGVTIRNQVPAASDGAPVDYTGSTALLIDDFAGIRVEE